jgi:hypothetical protein
VTSKWIITIEQMWCTRPLFVLKIHYFQLIWCPIWEFLLQKQFVFNNIIYKMLHTYAKKTAWKMKVFFSPFQLSFVSKHLSSLNKCFYFLDHLTGRWKLCKKEPNSNLIENQLDKQMQLWPQLLKSAKNQTKKSNINFNIKIIFTFW